AYVDVREDFAWIGDGETFLWTSDAWLTEEPMPPVADGGAAPALRTRRVYEMFWNREAWTRAQPVRVDHFDEARDALTPIGVDLLGIDHVRGRDLMFGACDGNATQKYLFATK